jgi:hypothetical protein
LVHRKVLDFDGMKLNDEELMSLVEASGELPFPTFSDNWLLASEYGSTVDSLSVDSFQIMAVP